MRSFTGTQKQVTNVDKKLINQFNATKGLTAQLKQNRAKNTEEKRPTLFASVGKELLKQAQQEKQEEKLHPKHSGSQMNIESEVRALSNFQKPNFNPKVEEMIKKQRYSRRERHIKVTDDFENWVQKLNADLDDGYKGIKSDVVDYFKLSDIEIEEYFNSMSDEYLLSREKELLDEMRLLIEEHEKNRNDRVQGLDTRLDSQEQERKDNLDFFVENWENQLNEIAFMLKPEVNEIVEKKKEEFRKLLEANYEKNAEYVKEINENQQQKFKAFEEKREEVEKRWRELRHNEALDFFFEDIKLMEYVNPEERKELYIDWKIKVKDIFDRRVHFLNKLVGCEMRYLSKAIVDKWIEDVKAYNDKAQQVYDDCFNELMKESERSNMHCMERYGNLEDRLKYIGFLEEEELQQLLREKCYVIVEKLLEDSKEQMKKAINYVEDADLRTNELLLNIGRWFSKIGKQNDLHKQNYQKMDFDYQLMQANMEDQNDENIDNLNEEFEKIKEELRTALHHPKLDEILEKCFGHIDKIEEEYRDVHEKKLKLVEQHPEMVIELFKKQEKSQIELFEFLDIEKKEELEARNLKRAQEKARIRFLKEKKQKEEEEERLAEELASKKGGKKPAPKKVDPKKQQAEQEQREKELLEEIGVEKVEEFITPMDQKFVLPQSMKQFAEKFYEIKEEMTEEEEQQKKEEEARLAKEKQEEEERLAKEREEQEKLNKGKKPANNNNKIKSGQKLDEQANQEEENLLLQQDETPPVEVDHIEEPPVDPEGAPIFDKDYIIKVDQVVEIFQSTLQRLFEYINQKCQQGIEEAKLADNDFIENSILILDERLKAHYPLKGKVEVEIYQVRSSQITNHKKRYERHARATIDKIDLQTEHFNFLLETGLDDTKEYETEIKKCLERLPTGHTLAKLQGILNTAREHQFKFQQKIEESMQNLHALADDELIFLLNKNEEFLRESRLFQDGGEYDIQEVEWYREMLKEINQQLEDQKEKRKLRVQELEEYMNNKKIQLLQDFEKQYQVTIEELSAKDGTGKRYGRPRRLAQEKTREEMNKCEKSQEVINGFLEQIRQYYDEYLQTKQNLDNYLNNQDKKQFARRVEETLMALRACIGRYQIHIQALKEDSKAQEMVRVSFDEEKWDIIQSEEEIQEDQERQELELENLGPLFYQKDQKKLLENFQEIEKIVIAEAQPLYTGEKARFLTGTDKIPDYLRTYLQGMQKKASDFRLQCIRDLRNSCEELSELTPKISEMILQSTYYKYFAQEEFENGQIRGEFEQKKGENEEKKQKHMFELRPNLSNPCIKNELDALLQNEKLRLQNFLEVVEKTKIQSLDRQFEISNSFFKALMHHFEFLAVYYDSLILWEDFIKLPGDEDIQKKHQNIKVLLRLQQTGQMIDTSSERSLKKKWPGFYVHTFQLGERKIEYQLSEEVGDISKNKGQKKDAKKGKKEAKKEAKKDAKKQSKNASSQNLEEEQNEEFTKVIETFKTYRQKSAASFRNKCFEDFKKVFENNTEEIERYFDKCAYNEQKFEFKWNSVKKQLEEAQK